MWIIIPIFFIEAGAGVVNEEKTFSQSYIDFMEKKTVDYLTIAIIYNINLYGIHFASDIVSKFDCQHSFKV